MAGSVTVQSGSIVETGLPAGVAQQKTIGPSVMSGAGNTIAIQDIALANGDNTITSPVGATWCIVFLTANPNNSTLQLSVAAGAGIPLNTTGPILAILSFQTPTSANSFHLTTSAAGMTVSVSYW